MTTTRHERGGSVLKIKTGIAIAIAACKRRMPMKELTPRRAGNEQQERVSKRASDQRSNDHVEEADIQHGKPRRLERTGHSKDDPEAGRLRVIDPGEPGTNRRGGCECFMNLHIPSDFRNSEPAWNSPHQPTLCFFVCHRTNDPGLIFENTPTLKA
jgi:hypothetical protein